MEWPVSKRAQPLLRLAPRLGRRRGLGLGERLVDLLMVVEHLGQPVAGLGGGAGLGVGFSALLVADGRGDGRNGLVENGHGTSWKCLS